MLIGVEIKKPIFDVTLGIHYISAIKYIYNDMDYNGSNRDNLYNNMLSGYFLNIYINNLEIFDEYKILNKYLFFI
jgi:hypothetical protein